MKREATLAQRHWRVNSRRPATPFWLFPMFLSFITVLFVQPGVVLAQDTEASSFLRIEVTGGEKSVPVDLASVYVRFTSDAQHDKGHKGEFNVKTNKEGVSKVPAGPHGKVTIQVIATGWKTFGQVYDITQDGQVVRIHLDRPPKWY